MKKILIIGAGYLQSFVIARAKELGYFTIAIDKNARSIGFKYADDYSVIDIVDYRACLKYARQQEIDGVITVATDYGVITTSYIAEKLNLPGLHLNVANIIKNKYLVRKILHENKVDDTNQYYEIKDLHNLSDYEEKISYPVIVKPCDGSGSKGIQRVDTYAQLYRACENAMKHSITKKVLIEDFIEGKEFGVECFVYDGEVHILGILGKEMTNPPDYAELGHYYPSKLENERKIKRIVTRAIKSLGVNFGAVNMDILISDEDKICIIDIGARVGGNLIGSHIIPLGTGIDYIGNVIRSAVNDSIDFQYKKRETNIATRILSLQAGKIKKLPNIQNIEVENSVVVYHTLEEDMVIHNYHNNLDGWGYVIASGSTLEEAIRKVSHAKNLIDIGIVRSSE